MKARRWIKCWGGPILVLTIILTGTLLATLVLRELRPCGLLDAALRGGGGLCTEVVVSDPHAAGSATQCRDSGL